MALLVEVSCSHANNIFDASLQVNIVNVQYKGEFTQNTMRFCVCKVT